MREPFEIRARPDFLWNGYEVAIMQGETIATKITFEPLEMGTAQRTLAGIEGRDFLQAALDCAWAMGLRPAGLQHTTETIAATARHLEDMRAIAFAKLNVEKPNG